MKFLLYIIFSFAQQGDSMPLNVEQTGFITKKIEIPAYKPIGYKLPKYSEEDFEWMRLAIYWDAKSKSIDNKILVGSEIRNRVFDKKFPNSVKAVVTQGETYANGFPVRNRCEYSWYCDGKGDIPRLRTHDDHLAWQESGRAAEDVLSRPFYQNTQKKIHNKAMLHRNEDLYWMQLTIYWESRNQPIEDKIAVGMVVKNRVADKWFPSTIKEVITQGLTDSEGYPKKYKCQFTWYCDGKADEPDLSNIYEYAAWEESGHVAKGILSGKYQDHTHGALFFHAPYVNPSWAQEYSKTVELGHIYYKRV